MTQPTQQPVVISEEARQAAISLCEANGYSLRIGDCDNPTPAEEIEHIAKHFQRAINTTTEELQRENEELRKQIMNPKFNEELADKCIALEKYIFAAGEMDWQQVVLNGGPPCFFLCADGMFCGRAQRWEGHKPGEVHKFVSLKTLLKGLK